MFAFGEAFARMAQAAVCAYLPTDSVQSRLWKKVLHVPAKAVSSFNKRSKKELDEGELTNEDGSIPLDKKDVLTAYQAAIIKRADELFPRLTHLWRTPRGRLLVDRAEAAMIAKYAQLMIVKK